MHVGVDQAGHYGLSRDIHDGGSLRGCGVSLAKRRDAIILDQDPRSGYGAVCVAVEQARRFSKACNSPSSRFLH
jgi:hypothetical protein